MFDEGSEKILSFYGRRIRARSDVNTGVMYCLPSLFVVFQREMLINMDVLTIVNNEGSG